MSLLLIATKMEVCIHKTMVYIHKSIKISYFSLFILPIIKKKLHSTSKMCTCFFYLFHLLRLVDVYVRNNIELNERMILNSLID